MSESTSSAAREILAACVRGERWSPESLRRLISGAHTPEGSRALFGILAEGLSDLFEPRLADAYADLFSEVIASVLPEYPAAELRARYERVRRPRPFAGDPDRVNAVFVLSRVTLGADVAITSVILDAARRRFPRSRIVLAAGAKSYELFAGDSRIEHLPVAYGRAGTLAERLAAGRELSRAVSRPGSIVIDPDSRLTQLGLLPVCPEENYYLFESRAYGAETEDSLACLAARWAAEVFGIEGARPYVALKGAARERPGIAVSLGVGDNPAKRLPDPFEARLLESLAARGESVIVDTGAGGEESERVRRAASGRAQTFRGSFAEFASIIARSRLYVGYDSAGQHAAAALGVPLVTVFAGFPSPRMLARWRPAGPGPVEVVRVDRPDPDDALARTLAAIDRVLRAGS